MNRNVKWNVKWNREKVIPLLLGIYVLLAIAAYFVLPERLAQEKNRPADAAVSAPLELPGELRARLSADAAVHADPQSAPGMEDAEDTGVDEPIDASEMDGSEIDEPEMNKPEIDEPEAEEDMPENNKNSAETGDRNGDTDTTADEAEKPATAHIVTADAGTSVNVRAAASPDAKITATLHDGDTVVIRSVSGKWYEIQKDDIVGYVHQDYIKKN